MCNTPCSWMCYHNCLEKYSMVNYYHHNFYFLPFYWRIGLAIAKQLARDGAKVMISSRKQEKVNEAVLQLEKEEKGCSVKGVVCHVAKAEHRKNLIEQVRTLKSKQKDVWFNMTTPLEGWVIGKKN